MCVRRMCVRRMDCASFYDLSLGFVNCSDSVVFVYPLSKMNLILKDIAKHR